MRLDPQDCWQDLMEAVSLFEASTTLNLNELLSLESSAISQAEYATEGLMLVAELIADRGETNGLTGTQAEQLGMYMISAVKTQQSAQTLAEALEHIRHKKYPPNKPTNDSFDG